MKKILLVAILTMTVNTAQAEDAAFCTDLLSGALYTGIQEDFCHFTGSVGRKLRTLYEQSTCRTIITQDTVNKLLEKAISDNRNALKNKGAEAFCAAILPGYTKVAESLP